MSTAIAEPRFEFCSDMLEHFGGIPADRIRLIPPPGTATRDDLLLALASGRFELIDGTLVRTAMGWRESLFASWLIQILGPFVREHQLGEVVGEGGIIELFGGQFRAPDVAYIPNDQFPGGSLPSDPIPALVPALAIEVLSRGNTAEEMRRKRRDYFTAGVQLVWEFDLELRCVHVYTDVDEFNTVPRGGTLYADPIVPGFSLSLADLFTRWDARA